MRSTSRSGWSSPSFSCAYPLFLRATGRTLIVISRAYSIAALRKNAGFVALISYLTVTFMLLAINDYTGNGKWGKAGGGFGILTAFIAYYCGMCELLGPDDLFTLPLGKFPPKRVD